MITNFHPKVKLLVGAGLILCASIMAGIVWKTVRSQQASQTADNFDSVTIPFVNQSITISPEISQNFSLSEVGNLAEMQKKYGISFTKDDLDGLQKNKFIIKNILDSNVTKGPMGVYVGDTGHELTSLYSNIQGPRDYKARGPADALFISSDSMIHLYSLLGADLLKETENDYLYEQLSATSKQMYEAATAQWNSAKTAAQKREWAKVRSYFSIPYALLSTSNTPFNATEYIQGNMQDLQVAKANYNFKDQTADNQEKTLAFIKSLKLDPESEREVTSDIAAIYKAEGSAIPAIFAEEYTQLPPEIRFEVPFAQFTVRGSYSDSSLRRQYFRAMQWYQQIPFFLNSTALTKYALDVSQLAAADSSVLKQYQSLSSFLTVLVGEGDDLDVGDYAAATTKLGSKVNDPESLTQFLAIRKPAARIKSIPAFYKTVGEVKIDEVINATRGMRFFSQRFTPDSYWTGKLTQGDEQPEVNGVKLPKSASSLEVMAILGSQYAQTKLPALPYYSASKSAVDARIAQLTTEANLWDGDYWRSSQANEALWSINGLFSWLYANQKAVPQFMQSPLWEAKTLLTGSAFWTEQRHTNILYAKPSFAELGGGGGGDCDPRTIPETPQGYVEPQPELYDRLTYTAKQLYANYTARNLKLINLIKLRNFIDLMDIVSEYTKLELENTKYQELTKDVTRVADDNPHCVEHFISDGSNINRPDPDRPDGSNQTIKSANSRTEELRIEIVDRMQRILPLPIDGSITPLKEKRMARVVDVHGSRDGYVEEGTGVPRLIFVAVKDANGARLTAGFTYSHYEFLSDSPLTDEKWQNSFYQESDGDSNILYLSKDKWPDTPIWYQELLGIK